MGKHSQKTDGAPGQLTPVRPASRFAGQASGLMVRIAVAAALVGVAIVLSLHVRTDSQHAKQQQEARYQQFVQLRDDAYLFALVSVRPGRHSLHAREKANLMDAEAAIQGALALANAAGDANTDV